MNRQRFSIVALMILLLFAQCVGNTVDAVLSKPTLEIGGPKGDYPMGSPIVFGLGIRNTSPHPITIVALTEEMLQNGGPGLSIEVSVTRPDGEVFKLFPARTRSMFTFFEHLELVRLLPSESTRIRTRWEDPFPGAGIWNVLSEKDWIELHRSGSYTINERLLSTCFCLPGVYRVSFRVMMTPSKATNTERKYKYPEDLWNGELVSKKLIRIRSEKS